MSHQVCKENISLGLIDETHVRVLGLIPSMPDWPHPLERSHPVFAKPMLEGATAYQESPIWDWAGDLLAKK